MTIAIDCRMINASGIGAYLNGCLPWFLQSDHFFILLGNPVLLQPYDSYTNVNVIECNIKPFSVKELFFFQKKIIRQINKADVYFSPFFNVPNVNIPVFTAIHDIIFPDMPELTSGFGLFIRMRFFRRAYKKSKKIFTVSEFSKSRIEHHLGKEKQIIVTHSAIQQPFLDFYKKASFMQKKETVVFVGNIKKHKGLAILLEAFHLAKKEGLPHTLILIGSKENFRSSDNTIFQKINALGAETVKFTGFVCEKELMEIIAEAALLVQPSLYEGFGLPPLEAMVLGTPALISDILVFKEIYNDFPVTFFKTGDAIDLKNKMIELLPAVNMPPFFLPEQLACKYTFQKTASTILQNLTVNIF